MVAFLALVAGRWLSLFGGWERAFYDYRQILARELVDQPLHPKLLLVGFDSAAAAAGVTEQDLREFQSQLPRSQMAGRLLDFELPTAAGGDGILRSVKLAEVDPSGRPAPTALLNFVAGGAEISFGKGKIQVGELTLWTAEDYSYYPLFHFAETSGIGAYGAEMFRLAPVSLMRAVELPLPDHLVIFGQDQRTAEETRVNTPTGTMSRLELAGALADSLLRGNGWRRLSPARQYLTELLFLLTLGILLRGRGALDAFGVLLLGSMGWLGLHLGMVTQGWFGEVVPGLVAGVVLLVSLLLLQLPRALTLVYSFGSRREVVFEERVVTVLFTNLPSHLLELEQNQNELSRQKRRDYSEALGEVCGRYGGAILDQQGDAQMVAFGLDREEPAHALRASAAALELAVRVPLLEKEWGVEAPDGGHCGVCTGPVATGEVGAQGLRAAAAIGDTTNTAARLMGAAKKMGLAVLVSKPTYEAAAPRLGAEELEPLQLKGKAEPVPVFLAKTLHLLPEPLAPAPREKSRVGWLLSGSLALAAVALATLFGPLEQLSWWLWDRPLVGPVGGDRAVIVARIDEQSHAFRSWPWPRDLHARVLQNCEQAGARCVFFDLIFDLPSEAAADARLAEAVTASQTVVVAGVAVRESVTAQAGEPALLPGLDARTLAEQSKLGLIHYRADPHDSVIRSFDTVFRELPVVYPSAGLAVAARWVGRGWKELNRPDEVLIGWDVGSHRHLSYHRLLNPEDPIFQEMNGAVVVIGDGLSGPSDRFSTPIGPLKGVEIHALLARALATGEARADLRNSNFWWPLGLLLAWLCVFGCWRVQGAGNYALVIGVGLLGAYLLHLAMMRLGWAHGGQLLSSVLVAGLLLVAAKTALAVAALRRLVPDQVVHELVSTGSAQDRTLEATVLVTDIRGYTSLSEGRTPLEILELLNEYHDATVACYERYGGSVLTYQGDAQLVVFGALNRVSQPQRQAVLAARELQKVVASLRHRWKLSADEEFDVGAGLCTGVVTVGLLKAGQSYQYTVTGEPVRRAHKLQSLSDTVGRKVLLDRRTFELCRGSLEFESLDSPEGPIFCG